MFNFVDRADCPCEFDNGVCWTCKFEVKELIQQNSG